MLRRTFFIIAGISMLLLVFSGCNNAETAQTESMLRSYSTTMREEDIPTSASLEDLTEQTIYARYAEAENITFEDYNCTDDIGYLAFSFINNQNTCFGFTVAERVGDQYKLSWFEAFPVFKSKPVTVFKWGGSYPRTEDRAIHITAGYVKNNFIKEIVLYYSGSTKTIKLDDSQNMFFDINPDADSDYSLLKFECKSGIGLILYREDYS